MTDNNLSTLFLLPLLKLNNSWLRSFNKRKRLVNAYIQTDLFEDYNEDHLLLVISNYQSMDFKEQYDALISNQHCEGEYSLLQDNYLMLIYNMSSFDDYYKFLEGRYSEYSDWAKNICMTAGYDNISVQHVVNKELERKAVIAQMFNMTNEELGDAELAPIWSEGSVSNIFTKQIMEQLPYNKKLITDGKKVIQGST
jgi:hypothetical protein